MYWIKYRKGERTVCRIFYTRDAAISFELDLWDNKVPVVSYNIPGY